MSKRPFEERKQDYLRIMETAKKIGVQHPELFAAQWALESDWGEKVIGKHNYWGVKAGNGDPNNDSQGTVGWTNEYIKGKKTLMKQKFRDYESLEDAIRARYAFTSKKGGRYDKAGYFRASSPAEAAMALQKAGYATDPYYADSLIKVMRGIGVDPYNGQQYDYSTTQPQPIASTIPVQSIQPTEQVPQWLNAFSSPTEEPQLNPYQPLADNIEQIKNSFEQIEPFSAAIPEQPKPNNRVKYQKELANAFGVEPSTKDMMPDHIGDLVRSIYDQTT